jgi:hypothetical protein
MKGVLRKIGMAVMSVLLALIVFRLLPAQTGYAAALSPIPVTLDYFHDNSGYYPSGDDTLGPAYNWIGTHFDSTYGTAETVMQFDLSSIPASDPVSSAILKLRVTDTDYDLSSQLFVNVYGSNDDNVTENSTKVPTKDVTIVSNQTGIIKNQDLLIDLTSYISGQAAGDRKATLVLTSKVTPGTSNQFAIASNQTGANAPTLNVTTATNAKVTSVSVPGNATYKAGQNLDFTVNFDRNVTVTGTPYLPLTIGSTPVQAAYLSGSESKALTFRYTVLSGQLDTDGVALGGAITLNGGTIKNVSNEDSILTLNGVASLTNVKVDAVAPTVSSVTVPTNKTYGSGQSLTFAVNFNEPVTVSGGTPSISLVIGVTTVQATYTGGTGTNSLAFSYTLQDGQSDTNGITVGAINLNGATMADAAGNAAVLLLNNTGNTTGVLVDATAPTVSTVDVPADSTYKSADQLNFTVHYNENVTVTGTPYLPVTIGSTPVQASYVSGSGTQNLLFRYSIQAGDSDTDGIVAGSSLTLNGGTIRDGATNNASLTLAGIGSTSAVLVDAVAPAINNVDVPTAGTYLAGENLAFTVHYNENVTVNVTGGTPYLQITIGSTPVHAAYVSGSGTNSLLFSYTVQAGDVDTDGITAATSITLNGGTIKDTASNNANLSLNSVGSTASVLVDTLAPSVSSVNVPANQAYGAGAQLNFTVHYSKKVNVASGTPSIPVTIGSSTVQAAYLSGSGTDTLEFRYVVQAGDNDNNGIAIGNAIVLNGSTLLDESGNAATLTLAGVGSTTAVLVDTTAPAATTVDVPADGSYKMGSTLDFIVHYSESIMVTGTPSLPLTIGSTTVQANYVSGSGTNALVFRYTVLNGQVDSDGVEAGNTLALNGGTLKDAAGNTAGLSLTGIGDTSAVLVDAVAPSVVSIDVPADGIYKAGTALAITIHYSEKVAVTGSPYVAVTIGSSTVHAVYVSGSGTNDLTFSYTVQAGDTDTDGIELGSISLNSGTLNDAAGNTASLSLTAAGSTSDVLVDTTAPAIVSVDVPANGTYKAGEDLEFTVHYSEKVTVTGGTPTLPITVGGATAQAVYVSGSDTNALLFRYEVQAGDNDIDGIQVGSSLSLNGAVLQDAANNAAALSLVGTGSTSAVLVDTTTPTVSSVDVPSNGSYNEGSIVNLTVHFNEKVTLTGTPSIPVTIGSTTVQAAYVSGSGTDTLLFRYTILSGQLDKDGIVVGSAISLNGGTLQDVAGNAAGLTLAAVGSTNAVLVDAIAPSIDSVNLPVNGTYTAGQQLNVTLHYDEAITVTGTPSISVTIGSATVNASYVSGSGTDTIVFRYTVQNGDNDSDGIEVGTLALNGGALKDATGNNAATALSGLGSTAAIKVDAVSPEATSLDVPANGTYKAGEALNFTVYYSEAVNVTGGTPYLSLTIGATPVQALYVSGSGTNELLFRYTIADGSEDTNGIEVSSSVNLNGAALQDATGNAAGIALSGAGSISTVLVDAIVPAIINVSVPVNGIYKAGDHLNFLVNFNESVLVNTGVPYLTITIGSTTVQAGYVSGSGTSALQFEYEVQTGELDADGIAVGSAIVLSGSSIKDVAGNAAGLTLAAVGSTSDIRVDAIAPSIDSVDLPANGTYTVGQQLNFTIHFDEVVAVTGTPSISVTFGSSTVQASYVSGYGTDTLVFRYTVQNGDNDSDGITVGALALNGGTIRDAVGNNADLNLSTGNTSAVLVDAVPPTVSQVDVPANGAYKAGTTLQFTVHYSENVSVTGGTPSLDVTLAGKTVQAVYVSGSGTNALVFRYEVLAGDTDSNGIQLAASLSLNGAALADQAGNSAVLTLTGTGDTSAVLVDTTAPIVSLVNVPADGTYHAGANLDFIVKISEPGLLDTTSGTPYIQVQIGSSVVKAEYLESVTSSELKFRYTVRLEDQDVDGISIDSAALALNGAVITDAAGNGFSTTLNSIGALQNVKISNNLSVTLSETSWTKNDVTVTVTTDPDNNIEYKLGSSGAWTSYTAPVVVSQEGLTSFYARVIDPTNHASDSVSADVKIDKTAPVIVLNGNDTVNVYLGSTYTEQDAKVQDANSAAALATVTGTVDTATLGTYILHYNAVDLAGNQAVEVIRTVKVINKPTSSVSNVRQVRVEVGDPDHPQVIVQIDIVREVIGGKKVDTVIMNEDKIKQAVESAVGAHQGTIRIIVDDIPGDPADLVKVKLSVNAVKYLLDSSLNVEIRTENATLYLSTEALSAMKGSQEFFFDIVPIRKKDDQDVVKERTINAEAVRKIVKSGKVIVIGMPMTIETNLPKVAVQVAFPLDPNFIPSDSAQRKLFLATLGVYIEHSDGEKVFQRGQIVYDDKGYPIGIKIEVNKFSTFTIVSAEGGNVHHDAYITGYSDGTFRPNQAVTRAEMSTMLYRLLSGSMQTGTAPFAFTDVSNGYWAASAIKWGQGAGILNGYPDHSFKPNASITRAEMASILVKWLRLDTTAANHTFTDSNGHWASAQIAAVAELGYMTGYADGSFRPDQALTRAEAVVIINRILERGPLTGVTDPTWKDVPASSWAFGAVEEASRTHDASRESNESEAYIPE